jgi:hypothetical protein
MSDTYIYYYKRDSNCEKIGRVNADDIVAAIEKISIIKQLSIDSINSIFVIECLKGGRDENNV